MIYKGYYCREMRYRGENLRVDNLNEEILEYMALDSLNLCAGFID
jgi:hypothetical protein